MIYLYLNLGMSVSTKGISISTGLDYRGGWIFCPLGKPATFYTDSRTKSTNLADFRNLTGNEKPWQMKYQGLKVW
jgi:hypothetical protein